MTILSPFPLRLDPLNTQDPKFKHQITMDPLHKTRGEHVHGSGSGSGRHRKRRKKIRWGSVAYQLSFSFFILLISVLLAGSGWGLSEQALRGGAERLNIFIVLAAYVFFVSPLSPLRVSSLLLPPPQLDPGYLRISRHPLLLMGLAHTSISPSWKIRRD